MSRLGLLADKPCWLAVRLEKLSYKKEKLRPNPRQGSPTLRKTSPNLRQGFLTLRKASRKSAARFPNP